ncbi:MAG: LuxR C-terminal-related transcriptional regulator [Lachnospiraceae bacterium]|nr:LuxR C-terminal-related transcriptional regulator [Lachnospiraceae bacterium]MDD3617610.1 LuxR C-terminal-related transcriptional regulator [Lachnospiraceae bacterium]
MLKNNDWIILNAITYKIHSIEELDEMRLAVMKQLGYLIDFDSSSFYITLPNDEKELTRPVGINYAVEDMEEYIHHYKNMDYSEGMMFTGKNIAYRESDLIPDEVRVNTEYYKAVYDVQNWHYSLHLNLCYKEEFLGVLSFFRNKGKEDFLYDDIFVLDMIKDHLALRLYEEKQKDKKKKMTVEQCSKQYGLSEREESVLNRLLGSESAEEIADILGISISTLRKHCNHIYHKLNISQRIELYDLITRREF